MVTGVVDSEGSLHMRAVYWLSDKELEKWEKVEK